MVDCRKQFPIRLAAVDRIVRDSLVSGPLVSYIAEFHSRRDSDMGEFVKRRTGIQQTDMRLFHHSQPADSAFLNLDESCHFVILWRSSRKNLEVLKTRFVDLEAQARGIVEINAAVCSSRLSSEDVPKKLIADFYINYRKILCHRRIEAGHNQVVVVHLAGVRNHRNRVGFGKGSDFASLGEATDAIGVELYVVKSARLEQLSKSIEGEFVLSACYWNVRTGFQLGIPMNVIGNDRFFEPPQVEGLQQW